MNESDEVYRRMCGCGDGLADDDPDFGDCVNCRYVARIGAEIREEMRRENA